MTKKKAKRGLTALLLVGIVFTTIGAAYLITTISIFLFGTEEGKSESVFLLLIFGILGIFFLLIGGISIALEIRKRISYTRMLNAGNYITAEITEVSVCYNVRVNSRHPYVVVCRYQDMEGTVHLFKSRYLFFDPQPLLKDQYVRVYVDGQNFKNYYVDIDEVLPDVVVH